MISLQTVLNKHINMLLPLSTLPTSSVLWEGTDAMHFTLTPLVYINLTLLWLGVFLCCCTIQHAAVNNLHEYF